MFTRTPQRRTWLAAGVLALAMLVTLAACAGEDAPAAPTQPVAATPAPAPQTAPVAASPEAASPVASEPKRGGILTLAHNSDPPAAYDTMRTSTIRLFSVAGALNGSANLVRPCWTDSYSPCPGVAESWEHNPDFTQWTFKIRDNIKWHDGTDFTPQDVKYWLDLAFFGRKEGEKTRLPAIFKGDLGDIESVEVLDGNNIRINLNLPEVHYLFKLMAARNQIAHPPHLMEPMIAGGQLDVTPRDIGWVSIGPFKMLNAEKGVRVQLRRNELYWETDDDGRSLPYLDGIDYAVIIDPSAMDAAFRSGRVEGGAQFPGFTLSKERKTGYDTDMGDGVWYADIYTWRSNFVMNAIDDRPFKDVRVRKAVALWMDKRAAINSVLGGFGYIHTIMGPTNPFVSPDFEKWPGWNAETREADRAEAKRLMAEAGYENGFPFDLLCRQHEMDRCQFVLAQLAELGIEGTPEPLDFASWSRRTRGGKVEAAYDMGAGTAEVFIPEQAEAALTRLSVGGPISRVRHEDPKVDEFFERLRAVPHSVDQRVQIYRELEQYLLVEKVYQVPLFGELSVVPYRSYVKGVLVPHESLYNYNDRTGVWLDK